MAFISPYYVPLQADKCSSSKRSCLLFPSFIGSRAHPATAYPPTRITKRRAIQALARRVSKSDEAFVTCTSCGSDELISASDLISQGSVAVRCGQCRNRWTARIDDAITSTGTKLIVPKSDSASEEGGDRDSDKETGVTLYVSGLLPKVDNSLLRKVAEDYGEVLDARVVYDRVNGRSRGFGFVTIVGKSSATAVMDVLNGSRNTPLGARIRVREARE